MGMDVYGRNPKINPNSVCPDEIDWKSSSNEEKEAYSQAYNKYESENPGIYFRANVWSWRPIHELTAKLCDDYLEQTDEVLIDEETLWAMSFNDGAGPTSSKACIILADLFSSWMEQNIEGYRLNDKGISVISGTGKFASKEQEEDPEIETESPYNVHDEHLKLWVEFLRNCGGFQVC